MQRDENERLISLFSRSDFFAGLPEHTRQRIIAIAKPRHFQVGQVIYLEGEPADNVYILENGWVKASRMSRKGREQGMLFLRPPEVFGDIAAMTNEVYPATTTALEDVDVWLIPSVELLRLVGESRELALAMIRRLSYRVMHYIEMVGELSLKPVETRLAGSLLQHVEPNGEQLIVPRRQWATLDEMAVRLGTVRNVLSRALRVLEAEGYIRVEKRYIVVLDLEGLAHRAEV